MVSDLHLNIFLTFTHLYSCKLTVYFIGYSIYMARCHQSALLKSRMLFTCRAWCICLRSSIWKLMTISVKNMLTFKKNTTKIKIRHAESGSSVPFPCLIICPFFVIGQFFMTTLDFLQLQAESVSSEFVNCIC